MNTRMPLRFTTVLALTLTLTLTLFAANAQEAARREKVPVPAQAGITYQSHTMQMPPLPYNPFPDLPTHSQSRRAVTYDDRGVDYKALRQQWAEQAAKNPQPAAPEGGNSLHEGGGNDLRLCIELIDGEVKRMSFNSESSLVYYVETSTNLIDWLPLKTVVADDTNVVFRSFDLDDRFYRVREGDDRIRFPAWSSFVEMYVRFDVWTSIAGTYTLQLFGDGMLLYQTTQAVPASGYFGVADGSYDPGQWPYVAYYDVAEWRLDVTVIPPAVGGGEAPSPAQVSVIKTGRRRFRQPPHAGITVQQYGVVSSTGSAQDDLDVYMENIFLGNLQAANQYDLDGSILNQFTAPGPAIYGTNNWNQLRARLAETNGINYLHYFGHGSKSLIGNAGAYPNSQITAAQLSRMRLTNEPLAYVIIDGCRGAENPDLLEAFMFFPKVIPKMAFRDYGWTPRFGASWKGTKRIEYVTAGNLVHNHFYFWLDFYGKLSERNASGFMYNSYKVAYEFAASPNHMGINSAIVNNSEAGGFVPQGCYECVFDQ